LKITQYPTDTKTFEGKITGIIGHKGEVGLDILEVLCAMKIPQEFSSETLAEAEAFSEKLTDSDLQDREDYRNEITYTIDGDDSKDLDDA
ncbi:ribonuclease R, partial [Devosia neptuniae]|nr:ribonuclease R [Devosia neptuniae]